MQLENEVEENKRECSSTPQPQSAQERQPQEQEPYNLIDTVWQKSNDSVTADKTVDLSIGTFSKTD